MPRSNSTLVPSFRRPIQAAQLLLTHPRYFWLLASLVVAGDAILTQLIIRFVPCQKLDSHFLSTASSYTSTDTEIDWKTYIVQTEVYLKGQRNYSMITGPTGPLV